MKGSSAFSLMEMMVAVAIIAVVAAVAAFSVQTKSTASRLERASLMVLRDMNAALSGAKAKNTRHYLNFTNKQKYKVVSDVYSGAGYNDESPDRNMLDMIQIAAGYNCTQTIALNDFVFNPGGYMTIGSSYSSLSKCHIKIFVSEVNIVRGITIKESGHFVLEPNRSTNGAPTCACP
jgi:prepilin-type N-terminal cleavage/methylation domain-containing protein